MAIRSRTWFGRALMAAILFAAACGGEVPIGEQGPPGPEGPAGTGTPGTPSISAVIPGMVFLGRDNSITVSGFGTEWTDATTLDFGDGMSVTGLSVASPTALVANVTTTQTAALGPRDVTVSDGENSLSYLNSFSVVAPLDVTGTVGSVAQGSIIQVHAEQRDVTTPFDNATDTDGNYPNLVIAGPGTPGIVSSATPFSVDGLLLFDVNAATGPLTVGVQSGQATAITSVHPDAVDVQARTAQVLAAGSNTPANVAQPLESHLYEISIPANDVGHVVATSSNPNAVPNFIVLDSTGSFANIVNISADWQHKAGSAAEKYYIIYWDNSGTAGYNYDIDYSVIPSDDIEPNDTCATAQTVASLPAAMSFMALSSGTDEDWFKISVGAADVGQHIVVKTSPGDADTDAYVEVFESDCTTSFGGPSADVDYHENHMTPVTTAAGDYYIKVTNSPAFPYAGAFYNLSISLPQAETEPNNDSATADVSTISGVVAAVGTAGDNDWYAVTLAAGEQLTATIVDGEVDTCGTGGTIDSEIEIYDSAAMSVAANDDIALNNYCSAASYTAATAGTYYIRVAGSAGFCANCTFDYRLDIAIQ